MIHLEMRNLEQNLEHPMVAIFLCFKAYHVQHVGIHDCVFLDFFPIIRRAICRLYGELQLRGGRGRSAFIAADNMRFTRPIIGKTSFSITQLKKSIFSFDHDTLSQPILPLLPISSHLPLPQNADFFPFQGKRTSGTRTPLL